MKKFIFIFLVILVFSNISAYDLPKYNIGMEFQKVINGNYYFSFPIEYNTGYPELSSWYTRDYSSYFPFFWILPINISFRVETLFSISPKWDHEGIETEFSLGFLFWENQKSLIEFKASLYHDFYYAGNSLELKEGFMKPYHSIGMYWKSK